MAVALQESLLKASAGVVGRRMVRTHPQQPVRVVVSAVTDVTPGMRRVTFTGDGLADYPVLGSDQYARLLLPREGQDEPALPVGPSWYAALMRMERDQRPVVRNYTLRAVRPESCEVDVDFVLHGDTGPAAAWAARVAPGAVAGLIEQGTLWTPDPSADHVLLCADETGLPAAMTILEQLPADTTVTAVLEVPAAQDEQPVPAGRDVVWLHRSDPHGTPGRLLLAHVPTLPTRAGRGQAWVAGESAMATGVRRHLVRERGYAKGDVSFTGYFKAGRSQFL